MKIYDMPKLECPFIRELKENYPVEIIVIDANTFNYEEFKI